MTIRGNGGAVMEFLVTHEVRFEIALEAASQKEAGRLAGGTPHTDLEQKHVVQEECIGMEESAVNPLAE